MELVALDIGGTNARFCIATIGAGGVIALGEPVTLGTSDHASLQTAWEAFEVRANRKLPRVAAIAIAGPVNGETVRMTNNSWVLDTGALDTQLGLDEVTVLNDFAAVAHAVASLGANAGEEHLVHIAGPEQPLPATGTISVVGPGTGLGVAHFSRAADGTYQVQATEGGHVDFAPIDAVDDAILSTLRKTHRRVSTERVNSGLGIATIYRVLAEIEKRPATLADDRAIWSAGLAGGDSLAVAAVDRFCMSLGSVAGDYALAHGASALVLAGGIGLRLRDRLPRSGFAERFRFKGRYEALMASLPVKLITHPQPGLLGAAAAFVREHDL